MNEIYVILVVISALSIILVWYARSFSRDPARLPPETNGVIVSPADGTVVYIERFGAKSLPIPRKFGKQVLLKELAGLDAFPNGGHLVGIYLSPFDVHVVRAPIAGKVIFSDHRSGHLLSKRLFAFETIDERSTCIIECSNTRVGVVLMAAYLVRRAILHAEVGDHLRLGDRIGKIRLGSQVDLILAHENDLRICTFKGKKVRAGESIVAKFGHVS